MLVWRGIWKAEGKVLARTATITVLDFEGTGAVRGFGDEPWQIGLIRIRGGLLERESACEYLLRVGDRPFNRYAPGRHAELRDALRHAPPLPTLWPVLRPLVEGVVLAAHNVATERRYLTAAFPLHPPGIWLDTLKLSRAAYPGLASYKLEDVLQALQLLPQVAVIVPGREAHDALYDAVGCAVLLCHVLALPGWSDTSLEDLVRLQQRRDRRNR